MLNNMIHDFEELLEVRYFLVKDYVVKHWPLLGEMMKWMMVVMMVVVVIAQIEVGL
jgi:hypothetical protein